MYRRFLIAATILFCSGTQALADPSADFMSAHPEVTSLGFDGKNQPPSRISFANGTPEATKQAIRQAAESFNWTQPQ